MSEVTVPDAVCERCPVRAALGGVSPEAFSLITMLAKKETEVPIEPLQAPSLEVAQDTTEIPSVTVRPNLLALEGLTQATEKTLRDREVARRFIELLIQSKGTVLSLLDIAEGVYFDDPDFANKRKLKTRSASKLNPAQKGGRVTEEVLNNFGLTLQRGYAGDVVTRADGKNIYYDRMYRVRDIAGLSEESFLSVEHEGKVVHWEISEFQQKIIDENV